MKAVSTYEHIYYSPFQGDLNSTVTKYHHTEVLIVQQIQLFTQTPPALECGAWVPRPNAMLWWSHFTLCFGAKELLPGHINPFPHHPNPPPHTLPNRGWMCLCIREREQGVGEQVFNKPLVQWSGGKHIFVGSQGNTS